MLSPVRVCAPNITSMYSELFYTYMASLIGQILTPPSLTPCCVAPFALCPPVGVHALTGEGIWTSLEVLHDAGTPLAKPLDLSLGIGGGGGGGGLERSGVDPPLCPGCTCLHTAFIAFWRGGGGVGVSTAAGRWAPPCDTGHSSFRIALSSTRTRGKRLLVRLLEHANRVKPTATCSCGTQDIKGQREGGGEGTCEGADF